MKFNNILRFVLPRRVISAIRLLQIFQHKHGHTYQKSGFPVNGKGDFQPWLTYPMIEFLNEHNGIHDTLKSIANGMTGGW